jgi:hypothetical protein
MILRTRLQGGIRGMSLVLMKKPARKRNGDVWRLEAKPKD